MLKRKNLFIVSISSFFIFSMIFFTLKFSITKDFQKLELELSNLYFRLLKNDLNFSISSLNRTAIDWARWDDSYYFVQSNNKDFINDYIKRNLPPNILDELNIDFIVFFDLEGNVKFQKHREKDFDNYIFLFKMMKESNSQEGLLAAYTKDLLVFSTAPITDTLGSLKSKGTLFIGYYLDEEKKIKIQDKLGYNFNIVGVTGREDIKTKLTIKNGFVKSRYYLDILNNQSLIIENYRKGQIITIGKENFKNYMIYLLIYFFILIILLAALLNKYIIKKLQNVELDLIKIIKSKNLKERVSIEGKDEINILASSINKLLDDIEEKNSKLYKLATFDFMTGIYNRNRGLKILEKKLNKKMIIIFIDINNLKYVNDTFSHYEGDYLIKTIVNNIKIELSSTHTFLRLGGDEFLLGIDDLSYEEVKTLFDKIKKKLSLIKNKDYNFGISIGIVDNLEEKSLDELINLADMEMYLDKKKNKE